jgi:Cu+-exporting ATPase
MGRYLEARAKGRTSEAITHLIGLRPKTATVLRGDVETEVPIEDIGVADLVVVRPGERIAVDGKVIAGESYVDESMISGEPIPPLKRAGDTVIGGTINRNSVLTFRADKVGADTMLSQIISFVEHAQGSRPPIQRVADTVVSYFIPVVLGIAILAFMIWHVAIGTSLHFALATLIAVLVIACPCALGLATPTAITVGVGRAAQLGVLIRNGETLEASGRLTTVMFDKTGTLTMGTPEVVDIIPVHGDDHTLLEYAGSVERNSQHPLGAAIVRKAEAMDVHFAQVERFDTVPGKGVKARLDGTAILVGNRVLLQDEGITWSPEMNERITSLEEEGKTVMLVAADSRFVGLVTVGDTLKGSARSAVDSLKAMGLDIVMVTGDNTRVARAIGTQLGIDRVHAQVLPQDKASEVAKLQHRGEHVAFVGDGINDAPALAQADVGIALGSGTDVAVESGDIVVVGDDLMDAVAALQLSSKVMTRIKQNLFWAFAYNMSLIPVAAGVLYPLFGITFRPELAGLAMAMSSVTVVSLSLRLRSYLPPAKQMATP